MEGVSVKCGPDRIADGGWKMRMTKCGWKIANDNMQMIKSLKRGNELTVFSYSFTRNKPGHLIEFRLREVQYVFILSQNRSKHFHAGRITKTKKNLGPSYMVSGTRDNPSPEVTLSSVYM